MPDTQPIKQAAESEARWSPKQAFLIAFLVCALIPVGILLAVLIADSRQGGAYGAVFLGSAIALVADFAFLVYGLSWLTTEAKRPSGIGLILGTLIGAIVGFGACMTPLGM